MMPASRLEKKAPLKGSFMMDHEHECDEQVTAYLQCIRRNEGGVGECREVMKAYLQCRMERGLMQPEEWSRLGLPE